VPAFEEVLARTRGRVLVSCFATSIRACNGSPTWRTAPGGPSPSSAAAWWTTPRRPSTSACCAFRRAPGSLRRPRRRSGRARGRLRLGKPGRAALGAVDDQRRRAPRRGGRAGTPSSSRRAIPGNERTVSRSSATSSASAATSSTRHREGPRLRPRKPGRRRGAAAAGTAPLSRARARRVRMLAQHARLAVAAGLPADRSSSPRTGTSSACPGRGSPRGARVRRPGAPRPRRRLGDRGPRGARPPAPLVRGHRGPDRRGGRQTGHLESPPEIVTRGMVDADEAASLARRPGG